MVKKVSKSKMNDEREESIQDFSETLENLVEENVEVDEEMIEEVLEGIGLGELSLSDDEKMSISKFATYIVMSETLLDEIEKDGNNLDETFLQAQEQLMWDNVGSRYFAEMPEIVQEKWDEMLKEFK